MSEDNDNIFSIVKPAVVDAEPIANLYVIVDNDGNEHFAEGFLMFTSQHIGVMRETADGAMPVSVFPLNNVKYAELVDDDDTEELPF